MTNLENDQIQKPYCQKQRNIDYKLSSLFVVIIIVLLCFGQSLSSSTQDTIPEVVSSLPSGATVDSINTRPDFAAHRVKKRDKTFQPEGSFSQLLFSSKTSQSIANFASESSQHGTPGYNDAPISDGLCNLTTAIRHSSVHSTQNPILSMKDIDENPELGTSDNSPKSFERAVICSHIDENNYSSWFAKMYPMKEDMKIQQIHIFASDSMVVFPAVDLICSSFDCSTLMVFNVSGQQIQDCSKLNFWLSRWPQLEVLDLSNTSLVSVESILDQPIQPESSLMTNNLSLNAEGDYTVPTLFDTTSPKTLMSQQRRSSHIVLRELTQLVLDYNEITKLDFDFVFERMPNLKHMSLVNNSIFDIHCNETHRSRMRTQLETVNLANNSINCDKSQMWFLRQFHNSLTNSKFPDYDQIRCNSSSLAEMTWSQRVSVLETRICDYCECRSLKKTAISIDCHNKNLTSLPDVLPLNTKILNLTSNRISSLSVPHKSKNWENVTYVYLENNLISSFNSLEFSPKFMRNLAALDIRRNKIQEFPSHILEQFINLDQIHLSNNPWLCDCESTFAFQEWLQRHFHKVGDKEEIRCGVSGDDENGLKSNSLQQRLSSRVIYKLSKSELCPQDTLEEPIDWLDVFNLTIGITIILILSKVLMDYVYQRRTKRLPHFFRLNIR